MPTSLMEIADSYAQNYSIGTKKLTARAELDTEINSLIANRDYWKEQARILKEDRYEHAVAMAQFEELLAERYALKQFATSLLRDWPVLGTYDGGDLRQIAIDAGLLIGSEVTKPCSEENCNCRKYEKVMPNGDFRFEIMCYNKIHFMKDET